MRIVSLFLVCLLASASNAQVGRLYWHIIPDDEVKCRDLDMSWTTDSLSTGFDVDQQIRLFWRVEYTQNGFWGNEPLHIEGNWYGDLDDFTTVVSFDHISIVGEKYRLAYLVIYVHPYSCVLDLAHDEYCDLESNAPLTCGEFLCTSTSQTKWLDWGTGDDGDGITPFIADVQDDCE